MIEEQGRVVAVEEGAVWVETRRRSTCSSCSAQHGCGQGLSDRLGLKGSTGLVRALCDLRLQVGDEVVIGIGEALLLRAALLVYLPPLLGLFVAAWGATRLGLSEPWVIAAAGAGFALAWLLIRWRARRVSDSQQWQPVVLRALLAAHS